jgi:glutamate/aspartate transport system substrate-binding protein
MKPVLTVACAWLALISATVQAQEGGTLEKIKSRGEITIGHRDASIPFSYVTGGTQPVGFAIDICMDIVSAIKQRLNMPALKVNYQSVTSQNRIPLVQNGTVDLECGSTTNSLTRQQQVAFSPNYIMVNVGVAVKKASGIQSLADLSGKTIVTTTGTTSIPLLRAHKRAENLQVNEIYGKDHADSFLSLESDRAVAFVMDDILLAGQIASSKSPGDYRILPDVLRQEPYGIMLRKDDPQFKGLVDVTVRDLMKSGRINALYAKWFTSPIPPRGINLNFPMTDATAELYRNPTDKGI